MTERGTTERRLRRRFLLIAVAGGIGLFGLAGCQEVTDFFSEYRGVNLIEQAGFDNGAWELVGATAGGEEIENLDTYVNLEEVSGAAASTEGLPNGVDAEQIRRFEIVNLFPNGDFDDGDVSAWVSSDGGTDAIVSLASAGDALSINGNSLEYDVQNQDEWINRVLSGDNGLADDFVGQNYTFTFDFKTRENAVFAYFTYDGAEWTPQKDWSSTTQAGELSVWSFDGVEVKPDPEVFAASIEPGEEHHFTIGAPEAVQDGEPIPTSGSLDNFRVARSDIAPQLRLQVPVVGNTFGSRDLPSGDYRFSLFVRIDPTHTNDTNDSADNVSNRFAAERATLSLSVRETEQNRVIHDIYEEVLTHDPDNDVNWNEWTEISVEGFLQTEDADYTMQDLVVEATLSPSDLIFPNGTRPGSLLIAAPQLTYTSQ